MSDQYNFETAGLAELRTRGYPAPKSTPTGKKYLELETIALRLADEEGLSPADWDLKTWKSWRRE